jgi:hypothetical protein
MSQYATTFSILQTTSPLEGRRRQLMDKLRAMADLPEGWSYGEGRPVTPLAISVAQRYIVIASQLNLTSDVFPNVDGGCAVAFYRGDQLVEVSISPDGNRLGLRAESGMGYEFENTIEPVERATSRQVYDHVLRLIENDSWKLFVPSIYASTGQSFGAFEIWSTETHQPLWTELPLLTDVGGFQSLKPLVHANP